MMTNHDQKEQNQKTLIKHAFRLNADDRVDINNYLNNNGLLTPQGQQTFQHFLRAYTVDLMKKANKNGSLQEADLAIVPDHLQWGACHVIQETVKGYEIEEINAQKNNFKWGDNDIAKILANALGIGILVIQEDSQYKYEHGDNVYEENRTEFNKNVNHITLNHRRGHFYIGNDPGNTHGDGNCMYNAFAQWLFKHEPEKLLTIYNKYKNELTPGSQKKNDQRQFNSSSTKILNDLGSQHPEDHSEKHPDQTKYRDRTKPSHLTFEHLTKKNISKPNKTQPAVVNFEKRSEERQTPHKTKTHANSSTSTPSNKSELSKESCQSLCDKLSSDDEFKDFYTFSHYQDKNGESHVSVKEKDGERVFDLSTKYDERTQEPTDCMTTGGLPRSEQEAQRWVKLMAKYLKEKHPDKTQYDITLTHNQEMKPEVKSWLDKAAQDAGCSIAYEKTKPDNAEQEKEEEKAGPQPGR